MLYYIALVNNRSGYYLCTFLNTFFFPNVYIYVNSSKSTATNDIAINFIKIAARVVALILTKLYYICISEGPFPNILKLSQIIPFHKKGPKNLCTNYCPVSLLSPFSKIFEKCLYSRLIDYLNKKKLITNCLGCVMCYCRARPKMPPCDPSCVAHAIEYVIAKYYLQVCKHQFLSARSIFLSKLDEIIAEA